MTDETKTQERSTVELPPAPGPANLARHAPQSEPFAETMWTRERIDLIKAEICPAGIGDGEFSLFIEKCKRSGLDPLMGEAYCVPRKQKVKYADPQGRKERDGSPVMIEKWVERHVFQAAEQGMQVRAHRAGDFEGVRFGAIYAQDKCAIDFSEGKVLHQAMAGQPRGQLIGAWAIARRKGRDYHPVAHVLISEYRQSNAMWDGKPETMIAKCARALALRLAYPFEFAGIFTAEEMAAGIDLEHTATPGDMEATEKTPVDGPPPAGGTKSDDLEAFMKSRSPAPKAAIVTPPPKASAATVNAPSSQAANATKPPPPVGEQVPPRVDPPAVSGAGRVQPEAKPADVLQFPTNANTQALKDADAKTKAAGAAPAGPDDLVMVDGKKIKIADATVAQLEKALAFARDQVAKSPTATWVPRVTAKIEQVDAEIKARAAALDAALEGPAEGDAPANEPPDPLGEENPPPEPGSDG